MLLLSKWSFSGKSRKSYLGRIRKDPRIHPSYYFCDFPSKMADLGWKILNFLRIQPSLAAIWMQLTWFGKKAYQNTSFQSHFWNHIHALKVRVFHEIKKYFRDLVLLTFLTLSYLTCHKKLKNIRSDPFFKCCQNRNCVVFGKNPNYPIQLILIRYNLVGDELKWWHALLTVQTTKWLFISSWLLQPPVGLKYSIIQPLLANHGKLIQKFFWNFHFPGQKPDRFTGKLIQPSILEFLWWYKRITGNFIQTKYSVNK